LASAGVTTGIAMIAMAAQSGRVLRNVGIGGL
jgi:hypothetical protein